MFSDNALRILEQRYLAYINGKRETVDEFIKRVSLGSLEYENELIRPLNFLPNSPTLFNIDVPGGGTLSACFKFDVSDTMLDGDTNGIMDTATKASMVIKWGGGVGYYLGNIRPKGSLVNSTHGVAMGPVAVMRFYHSLASMLTQSGKREAAQMGILPASHPDIMDFITCKDVDPQSLSTFNISVSLDDAFMERAVQEGTHEHTVLRSMARSAWRTGDPGVFFYSAAERANPTPLYGSLTGTNPCLVGSTKIHTVYEGSVDFKTLADRGTDTLVYAWNPETKLPTIKWMRNPRLTRTNAPILEIEFDSGLKVKCTPDHNFYSFRGEKVQAKDLVAGQSIRAFSMSKHRDGHIRVHGWADNKAQHQWVAHMVWEAFNGSMPEGMIVHHINHVEDDNRIENLTLLTAVEHNQEHYAARLQNGFYYNEVKEVALARNHKVVSIREAGTEDVYNGTVDDVHTYIIADDQPIAGIASGIVSANCGEVPLLNNEPCNLGSINLRKFYNATSFIDYKALERVVRLSINYLDDVLDRNHFPVQQVTAAALYTRKLGLGICGWADLLALASIPYASQEAVNRLEEVMKFVKDTADDQSRILGERKGVCPAFEEAPLRYRNATRLCIAPTGTIAILMDASSGIEPHYMLSWNRTLGNGQVIQEKIAVADEVQEGFTPQTAMEIPWEWHIRHQAAAQKHVDLAVSKTINMPNAATEEDIYNAYVMMWKSGLKGGTIYRDGCRDVQVLNGFKKEEGVIVECPECGAPVKHVEQCIECVAECGWSACSV